MLPLAAKNDNFVVLVIVFGLNENNVVAGTTDKSKEKFMYFLQFTYFIALWGGNNKGRLIGQGFYSKFRMGKKPKPSFRFSICMGE